MPATTAVSMKVMRTSMPPRIARKNQTVDCPVDQAMSQ